MSLVHQQIISIMYNSDNSLSESLYELVGFIYRGRCLPQKVWRCWHGIVQYYTANISFHFLRLFNADKTVHSNWILLQTNIIWRVQRYTTGSQT